MLPPQTIPEWANTYWVGGERPALPQSSHCWLNTAELDLLIQSPERQTHRRWVTNYNYVCSVCQGLTQGVWIVPPVLAQTQQKCSHRMWGRLRFIGKIPVAVEHLPQDWVVRFLCHWTFPPCMESWKVPPHHLNHAFPRLRLVCNTSGRHDRFTSAFVESMLEYLTVAQMRLPHK